MGDPDCGAAGLRGEFAQETDHRPRGEEMKYSGSIKEETLSLIFWMLVGAVILEFIIGIAMVLRFNAVNERIDQLERTNVTR